LQTIYNILNPYFAIPAAVKRLFMIQLSINSVFASFFLIMNIYLRKVGFEDHQIAGFTSFQFFGSFMFAFPLGVYIKGKKLKPFFFFASIAVPLAGLLIVNSVRLQIEPLIKTGFFISGCGLMTMQVCALPFILRNGDGETLSESISLSFTSWSLAVITAGVGIAILRTLEPVIYQISIQSSEYYILTMFLFIGIPAMFLAPGLKEKPPLSKSGRFMDNLKTFRHDYDWFIILKALIPTLLIAIGAGLTIPFVNLFFFSVFQLDSHYFGLLGSTASVLGVFSALLVPSVRRRYGYRVAILMTQSIAILFLIGLGMTEVYSAVKGAFAMAVIFYLFRQPFMHMAAPITSELTMQYVGKKNQELLSALNSTLWSASWFVSAKIFQYLRGMDMFYHQIFFITAGLYGFGVFLYHFIIKEFLQNNTSVIK
jgi:hypothetical protein